MKRSFVLVTEILICYSQEVQETMISIEKSLSPGAYMKPDIPSASAQKTISTSNANVHGKLSFIYIPNWFPIE